jgi:hypothetical protein
MSAPYVVASDLDADFFSRLSLSSSQRRRANWIIESIGAASSAGSHCGE